MGKSRSRAAKAASVFRIARSGAVKAKAKGRARPVTSGLKQVSEWRGAAGRGEAQPRRVAPRPHAGPAWPLPRGWPRAGPVRPCPGLGPRSRLTESWAAFFRARNCEVRHFHLNIGFMGLMPSKGGAQKGFIWLTSGKHPPPAASGCSA